MHEEGWSPCVPLNELDYGRVAVRMCDQTACRGAVCNQAVPISCLSLAAKASACDLQGRSNAETVVREPDAAPLLWAGTWADWRRARRRATCATSSTPLARYAPFGCGAVAPACGGGDQDGSLCAMRMPVGGLQHETVQEAESCSELGPACLVPSLALLQVFALDSTVDTV